MTPELRQRVEQLLDDALGLERTERQAFLDNACPQAPEVRAEVESLLAHYEQAEEQGLLANPPVGPRAVLPKAEPGEALREQSLGPYTIKHLLSQGGFGSVYLAVRTDGQYKGRVAIKVLKRGLDTDDILRRFANERQTLVALQKDPNIVTLLDGGSTADGRPYFVMEYVAGKPIDKYCDDHKLAIEERLRIFRTVCAAVHYAHNKFYVHRDLKPSNILVTGKDDQGHHGVKLLDFGIAKCLDPELAARTIVATALWQRFLTPEYASPEQVRGDRIDVTSDVYSLGVLLYELLTGHLPYRFNAKRSNIEQIVCEQEAEPPSTKVATTEELTTCDGSVVRVSPEYVGVRRKASPIKLRRKLAGDLDNIVLKALQKDAECRYRSVYELSQDVQNYLEGNPVTARGSPFGYRAGKFLCKHKGKFATAAAVFLTMACLAGWALLERSQAVDASNEAEFHRYEAAFHRTEAYLNAGLVLCERREVGHGMLLLAQSLQLAPAQATDLQRAIRANLADWRGQLHALRMVLDHEQASVTAVAFSPDGRTVLTASRVGSPKKGGGKVPRGEIRLWEAASGEVRRTLSLDRPVQAVAFSPDGQTVLTASTVWSPNKGRGRIVRVEAWLWKVGTRKLVGKPLSHDRPVQAVAFSPDGQTMLTASTVRFPKDGGGQGPREVRLWELASGEVRRTLSLDGPVQAVAFSADGQFVLTGSLDTARLWEAATGKEHRRLTGHKSAVQAVAVSPDAKTILTGSADNIARLWDAATGQLLGGYLRHRGPVGAVAFSPDGRTVLTGSTVLSPNEDEEAEKVPRGEVRLCELAPAIEPRQLTGHEKPVLAVAFSPDGKTVLTGSLDKTARLWDAATGKRLRSLTGHQERVSALAFSPDGRYILTGSRVVEQGIAVAGEAWLWDAATGEVLRRFEGHKDAIRVVAFSPDGKTVLTATMDGTVRLWDAENGKEPRQRLDHPGQQVLAAAFSPDARTVLTGSSDLTVRLWDAATGNLLRRFKGHKEAVWAVAFNPHGQTVLTGSKDNTARLWEATTGKPLSGSKPLEHAGAVWAVAFSPDGRAILTASEDKTARLWDAATCQPFGKPLEHADAVLAAAFSPDGQTILTGSRDGMARLWQVAVPVAGEPERIALWTQVLTGIELDSHGEGRVLDASEWEQRRQRLQQLGGPPLP